MSIWRVLGSVTVGIVVGVVATKTMNSKQERTKIKRAKEEGVQEARVEHSAKLKKLQQEISDMMKDIAKREQFIITVFALGASCAHSDGKLTQSEFEELDLLATGVGSSDKLSETTKARIEHIINNPPNLATAIEMIKTYDFYDSRHLQIYRTVIEMIVEADGKYTQCEQQFIQEWERLVS